MNRLFPNRVISRFGDIAWPDRSPYLSACDFFSLGLSQNTSHFKAPAPFTIQQMKLRIQEEVERIPLDMLQRVMGDFRKRLEECVRRNGGHLKDVIF